MKSLFPIVIFFSDPILELSLYFLTKGTLNINGRNHLMVFVSYIIDWTMYLSAKADYLKRL